MGATIKRILMLTARISRVIGLRKAGRFSKWGRFAAVILLSVTIQRTGLAAENDRARQIGSRLADTLRHLAASAAESRAKAQPPAPALNPNEPGRLLANPGAGETQVHMRRVNGTVLQIRGRDLSGPAGGVAKAAVVQSREERAMHFLQANRTLLRLKDPAAELALTASRQDEIGHSHLRYAQTYQGLPMWPAGLTVHFDREGKVTTLDGAYVPTPALNAPAPKLSGGQAVDQAKAVVPFGPGTFHSEPELILYAPLNRAPRLAWKFELTVSIRDAWLFVVDAINGRILHRGERVLDGNIAGSGTDLGGTMRNLNVWQQGNAYYMADTTKLSYNPQFDPLLDPRGVITIADAEGAFLNDVLQSSVGTVTSDLPGQWAVPAAVSAAFHFSETYDYYFDRLGRNSLDGEGGNITAVVRVGNYNNASWHGNLRVMFFGDVQPYAGSLDVVGHELTHGVTETSAGLIYENQSGALNESFSDIFGEMVEARTLGRPDWLMGSGLNKPIRNMRDPSAMFSDFIGRGFPSKMSEFADLANTRDADNGGVHINSSIINHAFYLLAEGLDGAVGLRDAERIFFRALTQHLQAQSEFIDCRLGCVAAAEELFGTDSAQARKTAQAFDAVEIFAAPTTPEPTPVPVVSGPDSTLFVYYDIFSDDLTLGRREEAEGDGDIGSDLASDVNFARPAVTGDGSIALFVDPNFDLCGVDTADPDSRECLGFAGLVHSVAISPDGLLAAFVLRDPQSGEPDGKISLLNLANDSVKTFNLVAPSADGIEVDAVLYADSMTFSTDSRLLVYDAISQLKFGNGPIVKRWSIYSLDLVTEQTSVLVPPRAGVDTGNPALGRAGNRYLAYDAQDQATGVSSVMVLDIFTGESAAVGAVEEGFAYPSFLGDESAVIYSAPDPDALGGYSLLRQNLTPERLVKDGQPTLWLQDALLGVIYRRGDFQGTNAVPSVSLQVDMPLPTVPATVTLAATASDVDGTVAKVEFYSGSTKVGEATQTPYSFGWQNVPEGNYRLIARAIDNLGATGDSTPVTLTVGAPPVGNDLKLAVTRLPGKAVRLKLAGVPGNYIIEQSVDLRTWSDIYPVTIDASGVGAIDDSGGPANFPTLFYRVRRE